MTNFGALMDTDAQREEDRRLASNTMRRFLIVDPQGLLGCLGELRSTLPRELGAIAEAFEQNIAGVFTTVETPLSFAESAARDRHWQRIHSSERIRSRGLDAEPEEDEEALAARRDRKAHEVASARMRAFLDSKDGLDSIAMDACRFLARALESAELSEAANEILRQGVVLTWSALEVLSRDLFETLLNRNPRRALEVAQEPTAKQRIPLKFTLEQLAAHSFNLSASLGSMLASQQDFSDMRTVKALLLPVLGAHPSLAAALDNRTLWVLCQQRHLIVHRRGIVDARYLEATGEVKTVGDRLVLSPDELESQLAAVIEAGRSMLLAAGALAT